MADGQVLAAMRDLASGDATGGGPAPRFDACQVGVAGDQAIERGAGDGGRMGSVTPAVIRTQPVRVTRAECGSMVKRAITEPSWVASAKPMPPSAVGATSTTFQV